MCNRWSLLKETQTRPEWRGQLPFLYLLYLDEAGNESDPSDKHFVLGGLAVFERVTFFLSKQLEDLQEAHFPGSPPVDFHASAMRGR